MGVGVSNPVDEATKNEIAELIKSVCATFTTQYVKWYAIFLCQKLKMDARAEPSPFKLLERPPSTIPLKTGWLTKEGGATKSWKKRFFVAKSDYVVNYYDKEEESKKEKGKTKGTMSLCGYSVIEDPNAGVIQRLTQLAEKMGIDMSQVPKPKEYPKLTFEVHHYRRRSYFIQAANEEDFKAWVDVFKTVCWRAYGFVNKDPVHVNAFREAVRRTRWELGRWGYWSYGGSEVQILSDLISDQIDYAVMGRIYGKIQGAWQIRNLIRNKVLSALDTMVSAAVAPAWKAMSQVVEELRPKLEPTIAELVDPIGKAEGELINKLKEGAMSIINPILEEHVTPHLAKIMEAMQKPMKDAYDESVKYWEENVAKFEIKGPKADLDKNFGEIDRLYNSWESYNIAHKIDVMYEPLWALHIIFSDIYPWGLIYQGHQDIRGTIDDAVYTFEVAVKKEAEENEACLGDAKALNDKIRALVLPDYQEDAKTRTMLWYHKSIKAIIMPPFNALVIPACKAIISPIADAIPEAMKAFVDPNRLFDELINGIIDESIETVIRSGQN